MLGRVLAIALIFLGFGAVVARANDSTADIAVGGLQLTQSPDISLDKEELFVSKDEVRVDYVFTNHAAKDIETLVAFPLPDQVYDEEGEGYFRDFRKDLAFQTRVEGVAVDYTIVEQALAQGADITPRITALGLPLNDSVDTDAFTAKAKALLEAERKALIAEGLLVAEEYDAGNGMEMHYKPTWTLRMSVTRRQVFPAGRSVRVAHRYVPLSGGSVGGNLSPENRKEAWAKKHYAQYCIEKGWFSAFDAAVTKRSTKDNPALYTETWIGYVLKSGANWKGPIKDFRLVVDKGKAENLVSFCAEGVKKISPTQFEVRKTDFEPQRDLDVLIVEWSRPEQ